MYWEPFCGSCNVLSRIEAPLRVASDAHTDLILLWQAVQQGWLPPERVSEEEYRAFRHMPPSALRGFIGFGCSYSGKWFGGYARDKKGSNYAAISRRSIIKQAPTFEGVRFFNTTYQDVDTEKLLRFGRTLVYCDPPYAGSTSDYAEGRFDSEAFWDWVRALSPYAAVFVSEYNAPEDFVTVWQRDVITCMHGKSGKNLARVEKLFTYPNTKEESPTQIRMKKACATIKKNKIDADPTLTPTQKGHRGTYGSPCDAYSPKQYEPLFRLPDGTFGLEHVVPGLGKLWWGPTLTPPVLPA